MKVSINQRGFSALMVLIIIGFASVVLIQISQINKDQNTNQPIQTRVEPKSNQPKTTTDIKSQTERIQKYLITEAALLGVTDNLSLYFADGKNSDETVSLDPLKSWIPASTIKAYVILEAFRQKRLGLINFDQTITIQSDNVVPTELETDEFPRLREGIQVSIRQLVEAMIIQSDNTAYNILLDILDRRNINNSLKNIGITETVVGEKLNLDSTQFQADLQIPGRQPNTTTVKDLATYFSLLYSQKIPDSEEILSIFKRQKINNMIPARLPEDIIVAHKTGDWAPIYHDGGIVYKPDDPFVFVAFTNSGDPAIVAKLAQVAYYQDAKYIGKSVAVALPAKRNLAFLPRPTYSSQQNEQVLGESTPNKFPDVTAEDLGITSKDLIPDSRQINNVVSALVTPGSALYELKKIAEQVQLILSISHSQKAKTYLGLANNRLSEIKGLLAKGDVSKNDKLLSESLEDIKNATDLAKNDSQKEKLIIEIKKTSDLIYAVMAEKAAHLPDDKREQFVDSVYNYYQKEKKEVSPVINSSVIVSPTQQKPTIGVIDNISSERITLKFEDGSKKQVNLSAGTNVRSVYQDTTEDLSKLKTGTKVAILGPAGAGDTINAQFILNNIPQGLTDQHKGTVTEINPNTGVIKVIDQKGQVNLVKVDDNTSVKSRDTDVSLEGIKAGSQVVVFGVSGPVNNTKSPLPSFSSSLPSLTPSPSPQNTKSPLPSSMPSSSPQDNKGQKQPQLQPGATSTPTAGPVPNGAKNTKAEPNSQTSSNVPVEIRATSVTVVGNSSGKNERSSTNETKSAPSKNEQKQAPPSTSNQGTTSHSSSNGKKDSKK